MKPTKLQLLLIKAEGLVLNYQLFKTKSNDVKKKNTKFA